MRNSLNMRVIASTGSRSDRPVSVRWVSWLFGQSFGQRTLAIIKHRSIPALLLLLISMVSASAVAQTLSGYSYRRAITIDHMKVANTDQSNFPALISGAYGFLATVANGGKVQNANGYDIIFSTDAAGLNKLDHEVESYDPVTGTINCWVRIPTLSHTTDTIIFVQFGNSAITTSQENKAGVWDSGYQGVWHLANGIVLSANDSTSNANSGTKAGAPSAIAGQIGGGANFGSPDVLSVNTIPLNGSDYTISTWFNWPLANTGSWNTLTRGATADHQVIVQESNWHLGSYDNLGGSFFNDSGFAMNTLSSGWHYLTAIASGISTTFYIDGKSVGSIGFKSNSQISYLGNHYVGTQQWGKVDELRVSNISRSPDWVATEYNNQNSSSTFYSVGPEATSVVVLPGAASLTVGQTQQFAATVVGGGPSVTWSISPSDAGSIDSNGLYTVPSSILSPATVTVTATSVADSAKNGSASVSLVVPYNFRRAVIIDHTKVPNTDQSDFPVLISGTYGFLAAASNGGNVQNASGYDIIFTSDAAGINKLDHEIESYDPIAGTVNFWVRIPALSHTSDTVIYLQYGKSGIAASQENVAGVWRAGYKSVYHFGSGGAAELGDSGAAGYLLSVAGTVPAVSGKVGGGVAFGSGNYLYRPSVVAYPLGSSPVTLETWFQTPSPVSGDILGYGANAYSGSRAGLGLDGNGGWYMEFQGIGVGAVYPQDGQWHHLVGVYAGGTAAQVYVDGALAGSTQSLSGTPNMTSTELKIGGIPTVGFCCAASGSVDEVRISSGARSADWIAAEYNNQSSPTSFYSLGGENQVGVRVTPLTTFLYAGQAQQFSALVTNSANTAVSWSISPAGAGSISSSGLYIAPSSIATPQTVMAIATSMADPSKSGSAAITLYPPVSVNVVPATATLRAGQVQQFTASVLNTPNLAVIWSASPAGAGSVDNNGRYTAPATINARQTITVTATSVADSTRSASASVLLEPAPQLTGISPTSGGAGTQILLSGLYFEDTQGQSKVQLNQQLIQIISWSDSSITAAIPAGAALGNITVVVGGMVSNGIAFTFAPPQLTLDALTPASGGAGLKVSLSGSGFGATQGGGNVYFSSSQDAGALPTDSVLFWSDTRIDAIVPVLAGSGPVVVVNTQGAASNARTFTSLGVPAGPPPTQPPAPPAPPVSFGPVVINSAGDRTTYATGYVGSEARLSAASGPGCSSCPSRDISAYSYEPNGRVISTTDLQGHITSNTYDADGNTASVTRTLNDGATQTSSYTYNSLGQVLTATDALGHTTTNVYDDKGNLLSVTMPAPDTSTPPSVTQFAYDGRGLLVQITDPLGNLTKMIYTAAGLLATVQDAQGHTTSYEYDAAGNRTAVVDSLQHRTAFRYDARNRLLGITYPDASTTSFAYDSRGRRTSVTDQNGKITTYAYDGADRMTAVTDAAQHTTHYAYDAESNLLSITDAAGHSTAFAYDAKRQVTQTTFPSNLSESYVYDAIGNLTSKTDRKGQTINYVYDALNRLSHKGYPDSTGVDYLYDLVGKIQRVNDPTGIYGFAYDNMGRLVGTSTAYSFLPGQTFANSYAYDAASNRKTLGGADGSTTAYSYDSLSRLTDLTNSWAGHFGFSYDELSRSTQMTRPNGVNTAYQYDSLSRLLSVLHQANGTTIDGASYVVDAAGNRTAKTDLQANVTSTYGYDDVYQLLQATQGATTTESYSYDPIGNRLSSLGMPPNNYNASNQLISTSSATYTYDNNGNTLGKADSSGTTAYTWDVENRLTSVTLANGGTVAFKYDPFGRRIQKSSASGTAAYLFDGDNVVEELDEGGNVIAKYAQALGVDDPLATSRGGVTSFYEQDALGSVTSLTDVTGSIVNSYVYDSFGSSTALSGTITNPFRFTGREWDAETGLYYYRARYYEPNTGRFISEDPIRFEAGVDFYRYVDNSPINDSDPFGMSPGGPKNPRVGTRCKWSDSCSALKGKIFLLEKTISSHQGWDWKMPSPRGGARHKGEIADFWNGLARCFNMYEKKCKSKNCDKDEGFPGRQPQTTTQPGLTVVPIPINPMVPVMPEIPVPMPEPIFDPVFVF